MATVGSDTFTESSNTALASHTPDVGSAWTVEASQFTVLAASDDVRHETNVLQRARKGDSIGTDDMDVSASCKVPSTSPRSAGVCARMALADYANQYEALLEGSGTSNTPNVHLYKNVAGVRTQLATTTISLTNSTYATVKLSIRSGSQEVFVGGVSRLTATEPDTTLQGQTYAGIVMQGHSSATTGLDTFLSESVITGYTLAADPGTYALTGSAAGLRAGRLLSAAPGTYALSGSAAGLRATRRLAADPGTYAMTGSVAGLYAGRRLVAAPGVYTIDGLDAELIVTGGGAFVLVADPGVYSITGSAAGLRAGRRLQAEPGVYAVTGSVASLLAGRYLAAASGVYALTGAAASLLAARRLTAAPGLYTVAGSAATLSLAAGEIGLILAGPVAYVRAGGRAITVVRAGGRPITVTHED